MKCELCESVITNKEKIFMGCDNYFCSIICRSNFMSKIIDKDPNFAYPNLWNRHKLKKTNSLLSLQDCNDNKVEIIIDNNVEIIINNNVEIIIDDNYYLIDNYQLNNNVYFTYICSLNYFFIYQTYKCLYNINNIFYKYFKNYKKYN